MNKKRVKLSAKLKFKIIYLIFNILLFSGILTGVIMYLLTIMKALTFRPGPFGGIEVILALLITSIIVGTVIGTFFAYRTITPIKNLSDATKEIAEGNFNVSIEELEYKDDDTELSNLIKNFNIMAKKLSEIETLRSDFIANVSHEFKTPLSTIEGYVTLLQDEKITPEERKKYTNIILEATNKINNLTSNILKISKLQNQEVELVKNEYNISEQIRETIIILESLWDKKNISFDLSLPDVYIKSDEELLQQVWLNIISNAIKFSFENSEIKVFLEHDSEYITVNIKDYGCGMSDDTISHIFDKFFQGDKSRSKEGNGLGLCLTKEIINLCKGTIKVESKLNEGSTFIVKLPIK